MKTIFKFLILIPFLFTGCDPEEVETDPDLVVSMLEISGSPQINSTKNAEAPIRVVIKNEGTAAADGFKTSIAYTGNNDISYTVAFTVPGQSSIWYPYTNTALEAGEEVTLEGIVTFNSSVHNQTVALKAIVDSCSGDEFMPDHCRVEESNEDNNESNEVSVDIP